VSNLPLGSGVCVPQVVTGSPDPRQLPFGPGRHPYPTSYPEDHPAEVLVGRSPVSCCLSAVGIRFLGHPAPAGGLEPSSRSAYRRTVIRGAGPQRGCRVAHGQDVIEQGAPFYPEDGGALPTGGYPPAGNCRFPTTSPYGPAGTSHRRGSPSRGVIRGSLTFAHHPDGGWLPPRGREASRSRRSSPRPPPPDGTRTASASTPGFAPRGHPQSTPRRRRAIAHWPGYYAATSAALHDASHFTRAPSRRT
jgi:hypothetical protein